MINDGIRNNGHSSYPMPADLSKAVDCLPQACAAGAHPWPLKLRGRSSRVFKQRPDCGEHVGHAR
jgi:hypothetical protein